MNEAKTAAEAVELLAGDRALKAGEWGYWPVIGATPRDIEAGDLVRWDDGTADLVAAVDDYDGLVVKYRVAGTDDRYRCGVLASVKIDRWGTHGVLARSVR